METLSSYMADDHHHCDALMRRASGCVLHGQWSQARDAAAAFQNALERHLLIEERILFPAFEQAIGRAPSPTGVMRAEHLRIRAVAQRMVDSVHALDRDAFDTHAEVLLLVLHQHGEKEEGLVYPMIERVLAPRGRAQVLAAMRGFTALDPCESAA
ncbi:hemerythrin domain-containing protein [Massilia glaciei]|nr:hemerythrin domain-containing protein [Massilia glaciei]